MHSAAREIKPEQKPLTVRGQGFLLTAMSCWKNPQTGRVEGDLLDWAEIQVLCCREKIEAAERLKRGEESELRACLAQLLCADVNLVVRALGCDPQLAMALTSEERRKIIEAQDQLNQTANLGPLLTGHAQQAYLGAMGRAAAQ